MRLYARECQSKTCDRVYLPTDVNQKYCSRSCSVAEASRRKKKHRAMREEVAKQKRVAEERLERLSGLAELLAIRDRVTIGSLVIEKSLPEGHSYHTYLHHTPELAIPARLLETIAREFRKQLDYCNQDPSSSSNDLYLAAIRDAIIGVAIAINETNSKTNLEAFYRSCGYEGSLPHHPIRL